MANMIKPGEIVPKGDPKVTYQTSGPAQILAPVRVAGPSDSTKKE